MQKRTEDSPIIRAEPDNVFLRCFANVRVITYVHRWPGNYVSATEYCTGHRQAPKLPLDTMHS
jgi:hypothetical protein